ncbi:hypothetical protein FQ137_13885 [Dietzia sp. ANT_WB102]|nr:hypothetical protein FQ137_13885 [Dietzia sp. ANT_WB102]
MPWAPSRASASTITWPARPPQWPKWAEGTTTPGTTTPGTTTLGTTTRTTAPAPRRPAGHS